VRLPRARPLIVNYREDGRNFLNQRANVVEYYARGMTSRQVASTLGLGRTTVWNIMKAADVAIRPQGRKY
jgi:transposase